MADEWLRAEQVAAIAERHHEYEAQYVDDDGNIVLREMLCQFCSDAWPCDVGALLAQDGRLRALVRDLLAALPREVVKNTYDLTVARQHVVALYDAVQAALGGASQDGGQHA